MSEGSKPLTDDLSYEVYEATQDLAGKRKRVDVSLLAAAPLFRLLAGRYYITVNHGKEYAASTEVEIAAGQLHEIKLELR